MHIICSIHAKERMEQRNITREQIIQAIQNPDIRLPTPRKRTRRVMKKFGSNTLGENRIVLVTVAWLKEEDRKVKEE